MNFDIHQAAVNNSKCLCALREAKWLWAMRSMPLSPLPSLAHLHLHILEVHLAEEIYNVRRRSSDQAAQKGGWQLPAPSEVRSHQRDRSSTQIEQHLPRYTPHATHCHRRLRYNSLQTNPGSQRVIESRFGMTLSWLLVLQR